MDDAIIGAHYWASANAPMPALEASAVFAAARRSEKSIDTAMFRASMAPFVAMVREHLPLVDSRAPENRGDGVIRDEPVP